MRFLILGLICVTFSLSVKAQYEISFDEKFVFNPEQALKELIPGTEDYYFYNCLYFEKKKDFKKVEDLLAKWLSKNRSKSAAYTKMLNRFILLTHDENSERTYKHLIKSLRLRFSHSKPIEGMNQKGLSKLDPTIIDDKKVTSSRSTHLKDHALEEVTQKKLSKEHLRSILSRIKHPDFKNLAKLIIEDLNNYPKTPFGSISIHKSLSLEQLKTCLSLKKSLLNNEAFVNQYIFHLIPAQNTNWRLDTEVKNAYLKEALTFTNSLSPAFNPLKAHILGHKLLLDRSQNKFDKELFIEYLKLPKNSRYPAPVNTQRNVRYTTLAENFYASTQLGPLQPHDYDLVTDYLNHFLKDAESFNEYSKYIKEEVLKNLFAETKILYGKGDAESWFATFKNNSTKIKEIKNRIELRLLPQNKKVFSSNDPIKVSADLKNIDKLLIKIYKINQFNYYKKYQKEISTDIELDGMLPSRELSFDYKHKPEIRHTESFDLKLEEPGSYIVEFIGNGLSSRALINKGYLKFAKQSSAIGTLCQVYNDQDQLIKDAQIYLDGHLFKANKNGAINIPYSGSKKPKFENIILQTKNFAQMQRFYHVHEHYKLNTNFVINRESLVKFGKAQLLVRPNITLRGKKIPVELLKDVILEITSSNLSGLKSNTKVPNFKIYNSLTSSHTITVPGNTISIEAKLSVTIKNIAFSKEETLTSSHKIPLNMNMLKNSTRSIFLRQSKDVYFAEVLGRTGEPIVNQAVYFSIFHKKLRSPFNISLVTDEKGTIELGELKNINSLDARTENIRESWEIVNQSLESKENLVYPTGQTIFIPFVTDGTPLDEQVSLYEMRNHKINNFRSENIKLSGSYLEVSNLPEGHFILRFKKRNQQKSITIGKGLIKNGLIIAKNNIYPLNTLSAPVIESIKEEAEELTLRLKNYSKNTSVNVLKTRFIHSDYDYYKFARTFENLTLNNQQQVAQSFYTYGLKISDEYRYILNRQNVPIYPGNMLERPSLLLNPWILKETSTETLDGADGDAFGGNSQAYRKSNLMGGRSSKDYNPFLRQVPSVDFLARGSRTLINLKPDENGLVTIPKTGPGHIFHISIIDKHFSSYQKFITKDETKPYRDIRFVSSLDHKQHYLENRKVSILAADKPFTIEGIASANMETYNSLRKVFDLMQTIQTKEKLSDFEFILKWPSYDLKTKKKYYSDFASHELNFFLYCKDPEFFKTVILPYYKNKKHNTFFDHWFKTTEELKSFTKYSKYAKLNIVEQILLAMKLKKASFKQEVQHRFEFIHRNQNFLNHLFDQGLKSNELGAKADSLSSTLKNKVAAKKSKIRRTLMNEEGLDLVSDVVVSPSSSAVEAKVSKQAKAEDAFDGEDPFADSDSLVGGILNIAAAREALQPFYAEIGPAKELVENNYYKLPIEKQNEKLIRLNGFWRDYALHTEGPFLSANFMEATSNLSEMIMALAVLDLPFESAEVDYKFGDISVTLSPKTSLILLHKGIDPHQALDQQKILVKQRYFDSTSKYERVANKNVVKYVTKEFLAGRIYGTTTILSNPNGTSIDVDLLQQIPNGAIPVGSSVDSKSTLVKLGAYSTKSIESYFYFPAPGKFTQLPVHASENGKLVAYDSLFTFNVVEKLSEVDKSSWAYISVHGSNAEVLSYIQNSNIGNLNFSTSLWRLQDSQFCASFLKVLAEKNTYDQTAYSYSLKHQLPTFASTYLSQKVSPTNYGKHLKSPLLNIDSIHNKTYQHKEYSPLINARRYQLGNDRTIANTNFRNQYNSYLSYLSYKHEITDSDKLTQTYYLLLQDRVSEALEVFNGIKREQVSEKLQYDYTKVYVLFYLEKITEAEEIAKRYADYPVVRWQNRFQSALSQIAEIKTNETKSESSEDRQKLQESYANKEASINFDVNGAEIKGFIRNLDQVSVKYYPMNIELLFSKKPFLGKLDADFSIIEPKFSEVKTVENNQLAFSIPENFKNSNVMIEISGKGVSSSKAYFANSMDVAVMKNYGLLKVIDKKGKALPKSYVKVYIKDSNGSVSFLKDGYTDLRGKFDYSSVNTAGLEDVKALSILVLNKDHGAIIKETTPPKQ
ncbi:MAG: hypothetical protein NE334_17155 [Lentisphaeraceae bacterium]|nr:hypothetical protein [Lentisphaeraceae bacterium]